GARLQHLVSLVPQGPGAEQTDRVLVLDNQDGSFAGQVRRRHLYAGCAGNRRLALVLRQVDREVRPLARLAVDDDIAVGLPNDPIDGRQAQAGAGTHFLSRKERLEDAVEILLWDAHARIDHLD